MELNPLIFNDASVINNKMMQLSMERQKVIANNMANADTPGYTRLELDFKKKLSEIIETGDLSQLDNFVGQLTEDKSNFTANDGNNVVMPQEMNEMMQNGVLYNLLSKAFKTRMNILRSSMESTVTT